MSHDARLAAIPEVAPRDADPQRAPGRMTLTAKLAPRAAEVQRRAAPAPSGPRAAAEADASWHALFDVLAPGPVQREAAAAAPDDDHDVRAIAARGVAGAGAPLPHLATLQTAFGRYGHTLPGVRAHVGGDAARASEAIGAHAYATGADVAFAGAPDLHLAAHEAAHVVQQRAGVSLSSGVGAAGDPYELHADRVADAVVRGESAEAILDEHAGGGSSCAVQRKAHGAGDIDAAIRRLSDAIDAAVFTAISMFSGGPDLGAVVDAATVLASVLESTHGAPPKATRARLEEVVTRAYDFESRLTDDAAQPIKAALISIHDAAKTLGVKLHFAKGHVDLGRVTDEDHGRLLAADVRLIDEETTIAAADLGATGEVAKLTAHVRKVAALLRDALAHVGATPEGGGRAALVDTVEELDPSIKRLDDWGRNAGASMSASGLEAMFDLEDRLYVMVKATPPARASAYYAGSKAKGGGLTQSALVDDLVRIYEADNSWVKGIAIDQIKDLLDEPPAPEKPDLLETILETAVGAFAGAVPGKLGEFVEALAGALGGEHDGAEEAEGGTPTLASIAGVITENVADGVMDFVKESLERDHDPAIKNRFVDGCRAALVQSVTNFGGALATYRGVLQRLPPDAVAQMHDGARAMPAKLWQGLKTDLVAQWMNFTAALTYGPQDADPGKLKTKESAWGPGGYDGTLNVKVHVGEGGVYAGPEVEEVAIAGLAAPLVAELKAAGMRLVDLPVHRYFEVTGSVSTRRHDEAVTLGVSIGELYLTASGELDISRADWFRLDEIARLGRFDETADDFDADPDAASPAYEALDDADHPIAPKNLQVVPEAKARVGAWKILRAITATTELLGGGGE